MDCRYKDNILVGINSYVGSISKELELDIRTDYNIERANNILKVILLKLDYIGISLNIKDFSVSQNNFSYKGKTFHTFKKLMKHISFIVKEMSPKPPKITKRVKYKKLLKFIDSIELNSKGNCKHLNRVRLLKGLN